MQTTCGGVPGIQKLGGSQYPMIDMLIYVGDAGSYVNRSLGLVGSAGCPSHLGGEFFLRHETSWLKRRIVLEKLSMGINEMLVGVVED